MSVLKNKFPNLFLLFFLGFFSVCFAQTGIPEAPKFQTSVYDNGQMLSAQEKSFLEQKLIRYNDTTSTQIVVVTINSLDGQDIALYGTELAHKWGIGEKGKDNGVLLLVSKSDRKLNITTGYGVEHLLTDALSRRIIENIIKPQFKSGNIYAGLDEGTTAIMQVLNGEFKGTPKTKSNDSAKLKGLLILLAIVAFLIFKRRNNGGGNGGRRDMSSDILTAILFSNMGRSSGSFGGGSFGGGSSGGFGGGFGGGGFGGGGASGSW